MMTFEEKFGELRSHLSKPMLNHEALWELLVELSEDQQDRYMKEVVYGYLVNFIEPLQFIYTATTIYKLEEAFKVFPLPCMFLDYEFARKEYVMELANSPCLSSLFRIDLQYHEMENEGALALAKSSYTSNLRHINFSQASTPGGIGDEGAIALVNSPYLSNLQCINLRNNEIEDKKKILTLFHEKGVYDVSL